jgi:hypothetical protein
MFEPIILNEYGDTLVDLPNSATGEGNAIYNHKSGRVKESKIGIHDRCGGDIRCVPSSASHNALLCWKCCLRIGGIPVEVYRLAQLRQWCAQKIENEKRMRGYLAFASRHFREDSDQLIGSAQGAVKDD